MDSHRVLRRCRCQRSFRKFCQKRRQLKSSCRQRAGFGVLQTPLGKKGRVLIDDGSRAGSGRHNNVIKIGKRLHVMKGDALGIGAISAVEVGLSAARLAKGGLRGKAHRAQQFFGSSYGRGAKKRGKTGRKQSHACVGGDVGLQCSLQARLILDDFKPLGRT